VFRDFRLRDIAAQADWSDTCNGRFVPVPGRQPSASASGSQKTGYVEEEFIVSRTANVYDWGADGSLMVKKPNAPYSTRILVQLPYRPPTRTVQRHALRTVCAGRVVDWL
jgi:hypothetical protein